MEAEIGRAVLKISGAVSANNYIDFDNLNLVGKYMYLQLKLHKSKIATVHLEVLTSTNLPQRISVSTLYYHENPRCLGRSLRYFHFLVLFLWLIFVNANRLPLPPVDGWMLVVLDLNHIIQKFFSLPSSSVSFKSVKRIQLCSNMSVRDVVTTNSLFPEECRYLPRELQFKSDCNMDLHVVDMAEIIDCSEKSQPAIMRTISMRSDSSLGSKGKFHRQLVSLSSNSINCLLVNFCCCYFVSS